MRTTTSKLLRIVLAIGFAGPAACSGASGNGELFGTSGGTLDGSVPPTDSGPIPATDGSTIDVGVDAGPAVNELDAPACHDLELRGDPVKATANLNQPPPQTNPLGSIAPGLYGVVSIVDYGGAIPQAGASRTTVYFSPTKQYYISQDDTGAEPTRLTLSWKLAGGKLSRTIQCGRGGGGGPIEYRADESPDGFTVYVPLQGGPTNRTSAIRYERLAF